LNSRPKRSWRHHGFLEYITGEHKARPYDKYTGYFLKDKLKLSIKPHVPEDRVPQIVKKAPNVGAFVAF
jgi:hypothetical protein